MKKKQKDTKKKPFWKNLLITKKTVEQDPNDKDIQWVTLDLYNSYEDVNISNKTTYIFKQIFIHFAHLGNNCTIKVIFL